VDGQVFSDEAGWTLFDHMQAEEELREILGRKVDLLEKSAIRNPFRRHHILKNHEMVYVPNEWDHLNFTNYDPTLDP